MGTQTVTRRVTAVTAGRYRVGASVPGVDVDVSPSVLDFSHAGQTRTFRVTFTRTTASFDKAATGFLTWKGKRGSVRIPLAVTPRALEAPVQVAGSGSSGRVRFSVTPGESGTFTASASGLAIRRPDGCDLPVRVGESEGFLIEIPKQTKAARFTVADRRSRRRCAPDHRAAADRHDLHGGGGLDDGGGQPVVGAGQTDAWFRGPATSPS